MLRPGDPFLRGRPLEVNFLGFRSDTYTLQQAGWQIAEEQDVYSLDFRIAIRHPSYRMSGMSAPIRKEDVFSWWEGRDYSDRRGSRTVHIQLAIQYMIHSHELSRDMHFFPVDATPVFEVIQEGSLYDMPYFRPIDEGKEIFLRKASVEEIMQIALDKQEPEQARIRASRQQEQEREEYARGGQTKAKLILVA